MLFVSFFSHLFVYYLSKLVQTKLYLKFIKIAFSGWKEIQHKSQ